MLPIVLARRIRGKTPPPQPRPELRVEVESRRRLRSKTPPPRAPQQEPLPEMKDFADEEEAGGKRRAYLVTFPHPRAPVGPGGSAWRHPRARRPCRIAPVASPSSS